jgi:signal transduction histidine kinase/DNA-binding response OmpR family regulator/ligand-binding sensor domain-containing protein
VGTAVGLNRYDGYSFETFSHLSDSRTSLSSDAIHSLHVDAAGRLWIGTSRGLDLHERPTNSFRRFGEIVFTSEKQRDGLRAIHSDRKGLVWVALNEADAPFSWIVRLNATTREVRRYQIPLGTGVTIVALHAESDSRVLFVARDATGKLYENGFAAGVLDPGSGKSTLLRPPASPAARPVVADERDISLAVTASGTFWIGAPGHRIFRLNLDSGQMEPRAYDASLAEVPPSELVSRVLSGANGELVVLPTWRRPSRRAGGSSIYTLAAGGELLRKSSIRPSGACDFTRSFAISGMVDRTGVIWTGISGAGMCVVDLESGMFSHLHESSPGASLSNDFVRSVWKSREGILWVGTRAGVNRIDRERATSQVLSHHPDQPQSLSDDEVKAVLIDRSGALWVGTQGGGLNRSRNQGRSFERFQHDQGDPRSIGSNHINAILEDRSGTIWISTVRGGLNRFHSADRSFTKFRHRPGDAASIGSDILTALFEDSSGRIWTGTEDAGLYLFDRDSGQFSPVNMAVADAPNIVSITEDPQAKGALWIATLRHGLARYDAGSGRCRWFTAGNSLLPSNTVYSVLADNRRFIWAGTNKGLVRIDPGDGSFRFFATDQGLQSMEFNTRACFRAPDGELLFGGIGGLNAFYPANIAQNATQPAVLITEVLTLNPHGRDGTGLYEAVYRNDGPPGSGNLPAASRELIFRYVALHYSDPARNRYRVKLEGFEDSWRDMGTLREATYTNLPPGEYRFLVRAATSRGVWSDQEAAYSFTIARPVHSRPWFVAAVVLAVFAAGFLAQRYRLAKLRTVKRELEAQVSERTRELSMALATIGEQADRLREADALKSRFMTNVSHDFRTPLTVTLGTLDDVQAGLFGPVSEEIATKIRTVMRNERRLLRLVNQMLAIARLDSGKLRLQVVECDLAALAGELVSAFLPAAHRKSISLELTASSPVLVYCDPEWIGQAITNLLSNAIKFSPRGGRVEAAAGVDRSTQRVFLTVRDNGPGIRGEDAARVFDRFFQAETNAAGPSAGIGVGLSLAKEIVELHRGEISVSSVPGSGATFRIALLPGWDHFAPDQIATSRPAVSSAVELESIASDLPWEELESEQHVDDSSDKPVLVIAEDDRDLREYLCGRLAAHYRVLSASSGDAAWNLISSEIPDLVVSDIMMPGMDGTRLCREMRSCPDTDFIPLVLITAKAETKEKIEGLECGADDYISKPFEMAELQARIRNLIGGRNRLRTRVASELSLDAATFGDEIPGSADSVFLNRVYETIRQHAHEQGFSVERLAGELAMSRMHLFRRLKAITGKPPTDILMEYRLERAVALLAAGTGTVSEIAYSLGFKNVSHFTRRFRERFGHTPSEHRAKGKGIEHSETRQSASTS